MNILFVCKYNRFRSKVAEALFKKYNKNKSYAASSAGIVRGEYPLDREQVGVAKRMGIKLAGKPRELSWDLLKAQDIVIIVADDVPVGIFRDNEYFDIKKKKLIVWNIPDSNSDGRNEIEDRVNKINEKIIKFVEGINDE